MQAVHPRKDATTVRTSLRIIANMFFMDCDKIGP